MPTRTAWIQPRRHNRDNRHRTAPLPPAIAHRDAKFTFWPVSGLMSEAYSLGAIAFPCTLSGFGTVALRNAVNSITVAGAASDWLCGHSKAHRLPV